VRGRTHITKVPIISCAYRATLLVCALTLLLPPTARTQTHAAQATSAPQTPEPAESLYLQLGNVGLDPARVFKVRDASLDRPSFQISLDDGTIAFTKDVMGRITGAFFQGEGEVLLTPPNEVERRSMSLFTGMAILEERFSTAYFRFNDDSFTQLQPGLRTPENAEEFVAQWDQTARNLAQVDAVRLLSTFSVMLPSAQASGSKIQSSTGIDPNDRMLHARLQGNQLGVFDIFFDSTSAEQIEAGQSKTENGIPFYNVWTSFSIEDANHRRGAKKEVPQAMPSETQPREDPIVVRRFLIDAHVKPPKQLDADVTLELDVERGGSRFLSFELSRFLDVKSVEADGKPVEFIHNAAVEGTRRARSGNDLVAVILPEPTRKGQQISLHFIYGGEVLADAGPGLLYVGARGTWYPNRGFAMADFDLTFHYPRGWTLLATGKPEPVSPLSAPSAQGNAPTNDEPVSRWISERPIPVAGFNLGKYHEATAHAGDIPVEAYATLSVEREFPQPSLPIAPLDPKPPLPKLPPALITPPAPSPAHNAAAVAEISASAIRYYAERFGPFPYSQLVLTQLPGEESQGWPGLIFLSSYAFLNREEQADLHMNAAGVIIDRLIPAHETAHQWWGDLVTWASYRDQWFSEGLANYCALMMEQEKNPAGFRLIMDKYRKELAEKDKKGNFLKDAGPVTLGNRLLSSRFPEGYEAISYGRGTWLFHMLRSMMQDAALQQKGGSGNEEPFVRSLHKIRDRYQGKAVTTRELLDVFAEDLPPSLRYEGKTSLGWFLDGWVNGTSLPTLQLQAVKFITKANATIATGVIRQKDAPPTLVTSVPIYAAVGKTPVLLGRLFADGPETSFRLSAPAGTHKLLLDPYETVLTMPKP
jgi:hypothetical protein